jgi:hypothetical protein
VRELKLDQSTLLAGAVVAAAVLAALVVIVLGWDRGQEESAPSPTASLPEVTVSVDAPTVGSPVVPEGPPPEVTADVVVAPREVLFGDTVTARFDVVVDKQRVDPDSVRVAADFDPWEVAGKPNARRQDDGGTSYVRITYLLRCVSGTCVPSGQSGRYTFRPARIAYGAASDQRIEESSIEVPLPPIRVYSRFAVANRDADPFSSPWRADVLTLPAVSYGISPGLLILVLLSGAALAIAGAVALAYVAWPRRQPAPPPLPAPPPPVRVLSPLEQALELLEDSIRVNGAAEQRRALEQVAEQLELSEWGDSKLAREARVLAWSEDVPPVEQTTSLAAQVRDVLPEVEEPSENGDGSAG